MGRPKGLVRTPAGEPWVTRAAGALVDGGCETVTIVLGAEADAIQQVFEDEWGRASSLARLIVAPDWERGMSASLRTGLESLALAGASVAVIHLVDLPDVTSEVVCRFTDSDDPNTLARAVYDGRPGHPVAIGSNHWSHVLDHAHADRGAAAYLAAAGPHIIECGDIATGADIDFDLYR